MVRPLASNRLLVYQDDTSDDWLAALRNGHTWVTNGPLLRILGNQQPPGTTFHATSGQPFELNLSLRVSSKFPLSDVEVIQNGEVVNTFNLRELLRSRGKVPPVVFEQSGWVLVRLRTDEPREWQLAVTSPFYVEFDGQPRVRASAVKSAQRRLRELREASQDADSERLEELFEQAEQFWQDRAEQANAS